MNSRNGLVLHFAVRNGGGFTYGIFSLLAFLIR